MAQRTHQHQTVKRSVLMVTAISFLLISISCGTVPSFQDYPNRDYKELVRLEIKLLQKDDYRGDLRLNSEFSDGLEFKEFLNKRFFKDSIKFMHPHQIFSADEAISLFKGSNGKFLLEQIDHPRAKLKKLIPEGYSKILFDFDKMKKKMLDEKEKDKTTNLSYEYYSKRQVYITAPAISKNGKYALISYTDGVMMEFQSGYHLFEKTDGEWHLLKSKLLGLP